MAPISNAQVIETIHDLAKQSAAESCAASVSAGEASKAAAAAALAAGNASQAATEASKAAGEASKAAGEASKAAAIMATEIKNIANAVNDLKKSTDEFHNETRPAMSEMKTDVALIKAALPYRVTTEQHIELDNRVTLLECEQIKAEKARKEAAIEAAADRKSRRVTPKDAWYWLLLLIIGFGNTIWLTIRTFWTAHVIHLLGGK